VSNWLRPDAATSPDRLFCHCYARGKGNAQMIPGWPSSVVAALKPGRTSWTLPLDAVRLGPADDATEVAAAQVREVVTAIIAAGHRRDDDPDILVVFEADNDLTRLAWLLRDLPAGVLGRLRSDRVMYFPAPPRLPAVTGCPRGGARARPPGRRPAQRSAARPRGQAEQATRGPAPPKHDRRCASTVGYASSLSRAHHADALHRRWDGGWGCMPWVPRTFPPISVGGARLTSPQAVSQLAVKAEVTLCREEHSNSGRRSAWPRLVGWRR
jgi:hypothetical protein